MVLFKNCMKPVTVNHNSVTVPYLSSIMVNYKAFVVAVIMVMTSDGGCELLQYFLISTLCNCVHRGTNVVQQTHDAWWFLRFNQITHNLVVEIFNGSPLDAFLTNESKQYRLIKVRLNNHV